MKKMRLVSIVLGVLLLVGMMSGVAMAQMSKESIKRETLWWYDNEHYYSQQKEFCGMYMYEGLHVFETKAECEEALRNSIPDYENFPFKYRLSLDVEDKNGEVDYTEDYYIEKFETTDKRITLSKFLEECVAAPSDPTDEAVAVIRFKNAVVIRTSPHSTITLLAWIPDEVSLTVLNKPDMLAPPSRIIIKISDLDKMNSMARCAIKENDRQWKFIDEQTHSEKLAELKESIDAKLNIITPEEEAISIPDYENFPIKGQEFINKDDDGKPDLVSRLYIREQKEKELKEQQKLILTTKDLISIGGRLSVGEELLAWIPELSMTIDIATGAFEIKRSTVHYAIKEDGQWKFIDKETYQAKNDEIRKSIGYTDEEIKELREKEEQDQLWY